MLGMAMALPSAFNLLCAGTAYIRDPSDPYSAPVTREISETYRIDLERKRWCLGDCVTTVAILKIEPTLLTLQDITTPTFGVQVYSVTISRETGLLSSTLRIGGIETRTIQQCALRPFTGFPPIKF